MTPPRLAASFLVALAACTNDIAAPPVDTLPAECDYTRQTPAALIPSCLAQRAAISQEHRDVAAQLVADVTALRDSFRADTGTASFNKQAELTRSLQRLVDFYSQGMLADSARFNRLLDHVRVTVEYVRGGSIRYVSGRAWPATTPWLSWQYYPNLGIYYQPVNTIQFVAFTLPRPGTPLDSVLSIAEATYRYAVWRSGGGRRFPVWEYNFPWNSGGVTVGAPWISGMAQGLALELFAEAYRRTGSPLWRMRVYETLESFYVDWNHGGPMLPDTSHGYWWEEYHPTVQVWNGSVWALLAVAYAADILDDPELWRLASRGLDAVKYYTPAYDTGRWTLYSRTQGYQSVAYHNLCIRLLDDLYSLMPDPWLSATANRWRTYTPPPGVR